MKSLQQFIAEAKQKPINVLLAGIGDENGRSVADLSYSLQSMSLDDVKNHCSKGIFKFKTKKDLEDFANTTASCEFWGAIYDYNSLTENVDYSKVNELMHRFGNIAEGKTLYIYTPTENLGKKGFKDEDFKKNIDELKERCDKASKTFNFASYQFLA